MYYSVTHWHCTQEKKAPIYLHHWSQPKAPDLWVLVTLKRLNSIFVFKEGNNPMWHTVYSSSGTNDQLSWFGILVFWMHRSQFVWGFPGTATAPLVFQIQRYRLAANTMSLLIRRIPEKQQSSSLFTEHALCKILVWCFNTTKKEQTKKEDGRKKVHFNCISDFGHCLCSCVHVFWVLEFLSSFLEGKKQRLCSC